MLEVGGARRCLDPNRRTLETYLPSCVHCHVPHDAHRRVVTSRRSRQVMVSVSSSVTFSCIVPRSHLDESPWSRYQPASWERQCRQDSRSRPGWHGLSTFSPGIHALFHSILGLSRGKESRGFKVHQRARFDVASKDVRRCCLVGQRSRASRLITNLLLGLVLHSLARTYHLFG